MQSKQTQTFLAQLDEQFPVNEFEQSIQNRISELTYDLTKAEERRDFYECIKLQIRISELQNVLFEFNALKPS